MQGIYPMDLCAPWEYYFLHNNKKSESRQQNKYGFLLKSFISLTKQLWGIQPMVLCTPWADTYLQKLKNEELEELPWIQSMNWWRQVKSQIFTPSPRTPKKIQGKKIRMYGLDTAHWQFTNTPRDKFQDQWTLIRLMWTNTSKSTAQIWHLEIQRTIIDEQ